jgi:cytochrome c biogenesis protein CcdA
MTGSVADFSLRDQYSTTRLALYALAAAALAIVVAGFWNFHLVDGFGRDVIAGRTIGDTGTLAGAFGERGLTFGFIFAGVAGLAATFTACNCVVFAMLPGLACSTDGKTGRSSPWFALAAFVGGVAVVSIAYGLYIGSIGSAGVEALNVREVRLAQAQWVFTGIGVVMLVWGLGEMGLFDGLTRRLSGSARTFLASASTKAATIGILVGLFSVGRPFPVFREFLTYAAEAGSPLYGAAVMAIQGVGQILVMVALFALLVWFGGRKLLAWSRSNPAGPRLMSGLALVAGGAFFVFYWGLAFAFDIGRWGFKLGWY